MAEQVPLLSLPLVPVGKWFGLRFLTNLQLFRSGLAARLQPLRAVPGDVQQPGAKQSAGEGQRPVQRLRDADRWGPGSVSGQIIRRFVLQAVFVRMLQLRPRTRGQWLHQRGVQVYLFGCPASFDATSALTVCSTLVGRPRQPPELRNNMYRIQT